jgi:hypothetical protein
MARMSEQCPKVAAAPVRPCPSHKEPPSSKAARGADIQGRWHLLRSPPASYSRSAEAPVLFATCCSSSVKVGHAHPSMGERSARGCEVALLPSSWDSLTVRSAATGGTGLALRGSQVLASVGMEQHTAVEIERVGKWKKTS